VPDSDGCIFVRSVLVVVVPSGEMEAITVPCVLMQGLKGVPVEEESDVSDTTPDYRSTSKQARSRISDVFRTICGASRKIDNRRWTFQNALIRSPEMEDDKPLLRSAATFCSIGKFV